MASLTLPVKVWVPPATAPGTTVNPTPSTIVAVQTCTIRKRDINLPPVSALVVGCFRTGETRFYFLTSKRCPQLRQTSGQTVPSTPGTARRAYALPPVTWVTNSCPDGGLKNACAC